jgi:serine/threonine protein phosphatase PrpC
MRTVTALTAAGATDSGRLREVNEDRFHVDEARGLFIVVDGIGGQAAGGRAADVALSMLRQRLERETGPVCERVREAIAIANNEIHRLASTRPEWDGMACVLTVAVVKDGVATIGHVGDTRLYQLRGGRIDKITHDHSPVGEREDAHEISELDAMRHPRRNEVYRDVGSEPHTPSDPDFVELHEIPFELDAALLLCSDGLTDLLDSATIQRTVSEHAGDAPAVVRALIDAANTAGGKDNVTAVYVEGGTFAMGLPSRVPGTRNADRYLGDSASSNEETRPRQPESVPAAGHSGTSTTRRTMIVTAAIVVALIMTGFIAYRTAPTLSLPVQPIVDVLPTITLSQTVQSGQSIAAAVNRAKPGSEVVVEPGEYLEHITLSENVRLVSRVPRGATIRLPATASDTQPEPAVIATGSAGGEINGFKIVGDARTPLGVGILVAGTGVSLVDVEISGAAGAAISFARDSSARLVGSDIHDNPGAALAIAMGAAPRITHSMFGRNGMSPRTPATFAIDAGAMPLFQRNVFVGVRPDVFASLSRATRDALQRDNWFHTER